MENAMKKIDELQLATNDSKPIDELIKKYEKIINQFPRYKAIHMLEDLKGLRDL